MEQFYSKFLSKPLSLINFHIDELCKPNPRYMANQIEQAVAKTRNKVFLVFHLILSILCLFEVFINGSPVIDCLLKSLICLICAAMLILSCRYHPEIFRLFYAIICGSYGIIVVQSGSEGVHSAWMIAPMLTVFQFLFTGCFWHFIAQALVQLVLLDYFYYDEMEKAVFSMTPEAFTLALRRAFLFAFGISCISVLLTHHFLSSAYKQIWLMEKKRAETEKTFLLSFSHELRNMINSLTGNAKLASLEKNLSDRAKELLFNAEVCGELLLHLVNNILDTGKVEIGELEINPAPTKIYSALEKIWGVCSELIYQKNLRGTMRIQKNIPQILLTDHYRLTQVFLNLVGNAIKFTDTGSVNISIEWKSNQSEITEACFQPYPFNDEDPKDEGIFEKTQNFVGFDQNFLTLDNYRKRINSDNLKSSKQCDKGVLKVTVTDTGSGMSKDGMKHLFQKFTQVSPDPSKRKLGTGLGLFITKQICVKSGGEVRVFSKINKGSCFTFCLPVSVAQHQDRSSFDSTSLKALVQAKQLKVMIVDDVPFNHLILSNFYERLGVQVTDIAVNGVEAYQKYLARVRLGDPPQIISMDIDMPLMNGKEASQKIRELEAKEGLSPCFIIIISGNCSSSEIHECLDKQGLIKADKFMKKPASIEEILRAIGGHFINT